MKRRVFFTLPICAFIPGAAHTLGASPQEQVRLPQKAEPHQDGPPSQQQEGAPMEKVTGIGGFFFRAKDPKALARWYQEHLGISLTPTGPGQQPWVQEAGPTAFNPFPETTKYFGEKMWMINFRVRNIEAMVKQLRAAGITVEDPKDYPPIGSFCRLHDPEGNPIELWQPPA